MALVEPVFKVTAVFIIEAKGTLLTTSEIVAMKWLFLDPKISDIVLPTALGLVVLNKISADLFNLLTECSAVRKTTASLTRLN